MSLLSGSKRFRFKHKEKRPFRPLSLLFSFSLRTTPIAVGCSLCARVQVFWLTDQDDRQAFPAITPVTLHPYRRLYSRRPRT